MKKIFVIALALLFWSPLFSQTKISVDSVSKHISERVTICSKVYGTKYLDQSGMTFLNVGASYPNSPLTIVIFGKDRNNFKESPETAYAEKNICVTGELKEYKGKTEIIVSKPGDIIIQ